MTASRRGGHRHALQTLRQTPSSAPSRLPRRVPEPWAPGCRLLRSPRDLPRQPRTVSLEARGESQKVWRDVLFHSCRNSKQDLEKKMPELVSLRPRSTGEALVSRPRRLYKEHLGGRRLSLVQPRAESAARASVRVPGLPWHCTGRGSGRKPRATYSPPWPLCPGRGPSDGHYEMHPRSTCPPDGKKVQRAISTLIFPGGF